MIPILENEHVTERKTAQQIKWQKCGRRVKTGVGALQVSMLSTMVFLYHALPLVHSTMFGG